MKPRIKPRMELNVRCYGGDGDLFVHWNKIGQHNKIGCFPGKIFARDEKIEECWHVAGLDKFH